MGKHIRVFFVLLLSCIALLGAPNYMKQIEQYDAQMKSVNNDEMLRIFHGLKAIYIQSIIRSDQNLKHETLERLIKTAKMLKLDASKYESELETMSKADKKVPLAKSHVPPPASEESFDSASKNHSAFNPPSPDKKSASSSTNIIRQSTSSLPKSYKGKNVLQNITTNNEEIVFEFGEKVPENSIKIFVLKSADSYKKVIDLPAIIMNTPLNITTPKALRSLRVSQYNTDTIRIVLDAPSAFQTYVSVFENQVILSLNKQPALTKRAVPKDVIPQKEASHKTVNPPKVDIKEVAVVPTKVHTPAKKIKRDKTVVIDSGHGGKDAGAIGYKKRMEKHLVLDVALQLGKELKERGYKVYYTRHKDVFINLRDRTKLANDKNADIFISLHANAAPTEAKKLSMKGVETFFLSPDRSERSKNVAALENKSNMEEMDFYSKETFLNVFNREKIVLSNKAAIDIQSNMLKNIKRKYDVDDGGVREAPFWVLVGATMPSVLIEIGYITNPQESDHIENPQYQKILVEGISNGIDQYFNNNP